MVWLLWDLTIDARLRPLDDHCVQLDHGYNLWSDPVIYVYELGGAAAKRRRELEVAHSTASGCAAAESNWDSSTSILGVGVLLMPVGQNQCSVVTTRGRP